MHQLNLIMSPKTQRYDNIFEQNIVEFEQIITVLCDFYVKITKCYEATKVSLEQVSCILGGYFSN